MNTIYNDIYDFEGVWGIPSKCKLLIIRVDDVYCVITTELYKENPGSTITDVTASLAQQICNRFSIPFDSLAYYEHNPETKTKLSFYDEEFFSVSFTIDEKGLSDPKFQQVAKDDLPCYKK